MDLTQKDSEWGCDNFVGMNKIKMCITGYWKPNMAKPNGNQAKWKMKNEKSEKENWKIGKGKLKWENSAPDKSSKIQIEKRAGWDWDLIYVPHTILAQTLRKN